MEEENAAAAQENGADVSQQDAPTGYPYQQDLYPHYHHPYPYYPYPYPHPPQKSSLDTATLALVISAIGLVYWFPPFVLPGVALYLAGKARKEIEAGMPVAYNAATFVKVARGLAIAGIVIAGLFMLFIFVAIVLAAAYGR